MNTIEQQLQPMVILFNEMNCNLKTLTFECKDSKKNYQLNFETSAHLVNYNNQPIVINVGLDQMNAQQYNKTMSIYQTVNKQMISYQSYSELCFNNLYLPSLRNLKSIRDKLNSNLSIKQIYCQHKTIGAYLTFRDAIHFAVLLLCNRTGKNIYQLNKPILFRISIDSI